jgi:predicted ribosomally synthesized peptide with nif11-like leader
MSKQNADKFLADINTNASLQKKLLAGAENVKAWLSEAAAHGYEMTMDELRAAAEAIRGKAIRADDLVSELRALFDGELTDGSLDAVTGGANTSAKAPAKLNVSTVGRTVQRPGDAGTTVEFERGPISVSGSSVNKNQSQE